MSEAERERSAISPPPFQWDEWYASVGGRTINIMDEPPPPTDIPAEKRHSYNKLRRD